MRTFEAYMTPCAVGTRFSNSVISQDRNHIGLDCGMYYYMCGPNYRLLSLVTCEAVPRLLRLLPELPV